MNDHPRTMIRDLTASGRIVLATMAVCSLFYMLFVLAFAQIVVPDRADGSLVTDEHGEPVGSALIAQGFSRPEYFHPRPSEAAYNAAAAGGSNYSPANPVLRARAESLIVALGGASDGDPVPADLVTESGSGLDPHITLAAARFQVRRVAAARGIPDSTVTAILEAHTEHPGGPLTAEPLVNVLLLNMALDNTER